jgi:hypothetical protein
MDQEHLNDAKDEHLRAEGLLDKAEGAIRKALDELTGVSRHLKERIAGEKKPHDFPVDDDPPGDTEDAIRGDEVLDHPDRLDKP